MLKDAIADGEPFRLVISDVNMPDVDGYAFVGWIREQSELADTPVIMLSSGGRVGDVSRREQLKISRSLLKPAKQSELFDAIVSALGVNAVEDALPVSDESERSERSERSEQSEQSELRPLRILLAEDNLINQKLVLGVLEPRGHLVTVANNGKEAVSASLHGEFDVILMDVQMPEMDGFTATRKIREREREGGRRVPIIAMTAHAMKGDRERCLAAGMDDYLAKPISVSAVLFKLAQFVATEPVVAIPAVPPAEPISPVDWTVALEYVDGNQSLLREVVQICLQETPRLMGQIRVAIDASDAASVNRAAHSLRGSMLFLGPVLPCQFAQDLELEAADKDLGRAEELYRSLESSVGSLREVLISRLDQN